MSAAIVDVGVKIGSRAPNAILPILRRSSFPSSVWPETISAHNRRVCMVPHLWNGLPTRKVAGDAGIYVFGAVVATVQVRLAPEKNCRANCAIFDETIEELQKV
jgi:hypothetical protein